MKHRYPHPTTSALDDYLYVLDIHFVRDGALCSGMVEMGAPAGTWRCNLRSGVVGGAGAALGASLVPLHCDGA